MRMGQKALGWGLLVTSLIGSIQVMGEDEDRQTIRKFSLPEYNEKMELVSKVQGDSAKPRGPDVFEITNLLYEMYKDGKVNTRVTSPFCFFDKKRKAGNSQESIRIARNDMVITGEDYEFNGQYERIHIRKNAKVVIRSIDIRIWGEDDEQ